MVHLWEIDHDYYCNESNFYANGTGMKFASWQDFMEGFGDSDFDMNLIFRWDWKSPRNDADEVVLNPDPYYRDGNLQLFFMGQRKGKYWCVEVSVCQADEPEVIKFLQPRFEHLVNLWSPFELTEVPDPQPRGGE